MPDMDVAALTTFLRSTLQKELDDCYGEPWWDYYSGPEAMYRQEPMREEQEKVAAQLRIVDWCVVVIGDRDLSRYGEFGLLRDDPQALAVTLAVETLRNLAYGYRIDEIKPSGLRDGYDPTWAPDGVEVAG